MLSSIKLRRKKDSVGITWLGDNRESKDETVVNKKNFHNPLNTDNKYMGFRRNLPPL